MKKLGLINGHASRIRLDEQERKQLREFLIGYIDRVPIQDDFELEQTSKSGQSKKIILGIVAVLLLILTGVLYFTQ